MIHTIIVKRVLREAVQVPYGNLVTRSTGAAVRTSIERAIAATGCTTALLDFAEVGLLDFSCADEVIAKLLLRTEPQVDRYVVLRGLREDHSEAIDHVLNHHRLAVLALPGPGTAPTVLGRASPDLRVALAGVLRLRVGDASCLAELLGWTIERAADALQSLALLRLLRADAGQFQLIPVQ